MKFFTRKKKPKIYNIAVLTAITAVFIIFLWQTNVPSFLLALNITLSAYFFIFLIFLLVAFGKQLQYNPYSYNTILYLGFAIFIGFIFVTLLYIAVRFAAEPSFYNFESLTHTLLSSARNYIVLTLPFILAFSIGLCISNVSLIRHEGLRYVNILGIILSGILIAGEIFIFAFDFHVSGSIEEVRNHDIIVNAFSAVYLYLECMLIGTIVADLIAAIHKPEQDKDYIIILGCSIRKDGTPTPLLAGRVDRAIEFAEKQKEETGKDLYFIPSGGTGKGKVMSESESMRNYMIKRGVPSDKIIMEDKSANTYENMLFSKEKIFAADPESKVAFSTTNYHVFRSGLRAQQVKLRAEGMGAPTKWYFWPNASVREFIGLLTGHKIKQACVLCGLIAIYIILTFVIYM